MTGRQTNKDDARQHGFTIVELLIVIVVIGILAAITVVGYNGIRTRADDVAHHVAMQKVSKNIQEYYALNGRYPIVYENTSWRIDASVVFQGVDIGQGGGESYSLHPSDQPANACVGIYNDSATLGYYVTLKNTAPVKYAKGAIGGCPLS